MSKVVVDSSAVLALLRGERGAETVEKAIDTAIISAVNLQEVAKELVRDGIAGDDVRGLIADLGLKVVDHDEIAAFLSAELFPLTKQFGSGLGDRSCMALALQHDLPALTADKEWHRIKLKGLKLQFVR